MRSREKSKGISLQAIAGSRVVLLAVDVDSADGLLGFTFYKRAGTKGPEQPLRNGRCFKSAQKIDDDKKFQSDVSPIQAFLWGDYSVEAGKTYTYRVVAQAGKPGALKAVAEATVTVTTEPQDEGAHGVYFNRGVAGSQAFSRAFGKYRRWYLFEHQGEVRPRELIKPQNVPDRQAYQWLSRGLEEALQNFIRQAKDSSYSLRAAVYEFTYLPVIQEFVGAIERGVDVKIVHHAKQDGSYLVKSKRDPKDGTEKWRVTTTTEWESGEPEPLVLKNRYIEQVFAGDDVYRAAKSAVAQAGLTDDQYADELGSMLIERTDTQISHNKFIVLLKDDKPIEVWTGSTNLTEGGIFGQYNVGHVVRDPKVATKYLGYWKKLSTDPSKAEMTAWTAKNTPDLGAAPPRDSITPIFSPRPKGKRTMLDWYADRIGEAGQAIFLTSAFTVDESFLAEFDKTVKVAKEEAYQRYILIETRSGLMREKYARMNKVKQNCIAWGDVYKSADDGADDEQETAQSAHLIETLTGLNTHVEFLHTKYLLIDPLSDDPIVVTGSANFSDASTVDNDENMLVVRGDKNLADIYLGEFMRLFNHFEGRNRANSLKPAQKAKFDYLAGDDAWAEPYFQEGTRQQQQRLLFR